MRNLFKLVMVMAAFLCIANSVMASDHVMGTLIANARFQVLDAKSMITPFEGSSGGKWKKPHRVTVKIVSLDISDHYRKYYPTAAQSLEDNARAIDLKIQYGKPVFMGIIPGRLGFERQDAESFFNFYAKNKNHSFNGQIGVIVTQKRLANGELGPQKIEDFVLLSARPVTFDAAR